MHSIQYCSNVVSIMYIELCLQACVNHMNAAMIMRQLADTEGPTGPALLNRIPSFAKFFVRVNAANHTFKIRISRSNSAHS